VAGILVVDDDDTVAEVVHRYLRHAGHDVLRAADGDDALRLAAAWVPDLVILDVMLPGVDGIDVCRRLRQTSSMPVVMLTALGAEVDRVLGLEVGADDYVTKPFSPRELVLRVQSVLRRAGGDGHRGTGVGAATTASGGAEGEDRILLGGDGLVVDVAARTVQVRGRPVSLTVREFDLLVHFLRHPNRAYTREQLLLEVWGWDFGDHSTVTVHVRRLRNKIEEDAADPRHLVTVWGVGYRWEPGDDTRPVEAATPGNETGR
jgi:DNA-binding response OmpR family regulator